MDIVLIVRLYIDNHFRIFQWLLSLFSHHTAVSTFVNVHIWNWSMPFCSWWNIVTRSCKNAFANFTMSIYNSSSTTKHVIIKFDIRSFPPVLSAPSSFN